MWVILLGALAAMTTLAKKELPSPISLLAIIHMLR